MFFEFSGSQVRHMGRTLRALLSAATVEVAQSLLGCRLIHESSDGRTVGRVVETEAYLSSGDAASHSAAGRTRRNASMFLGPGHAYVYLIYGVHHCFNVVTGPVGIGEAVLIRAIEPLEGIDLMEARRGTDRTVQLGSGPGKLVQALGITPDCDGRRLFRGALRLLKPEPSWTRPGIVSGPRVGIRKAAELPYRYYHANCRWRSK